MHHKKLIATRRRTMISAKRTNIAILAALATVISACGGGGSSAPAGPNAGASEAPATPKLSADQQTYENLSLAPSSGSYQILWNLNYSGPEVSGTNYAESTYSVMSASPLTSGPQTIRQSSPENMASTLALVTPAPGRVLKSGVILVVPAIGSSKVSYVGDSVQVDRLADDNVTVVSTGIRTNFTSVALTGAMSSTSPDFAHFHNSFFSNPAILKPASTWAAGASYTRYMETTAGDRYNVVDCGATTTDANVSPCVMGSTLATELTSGIASGSDATTYHLADGAVSTVGGAKVWIANTPRPQSATLSTTVQYRIYFELNGNVYAGTFIKDGTTLGGSYYVSNPSGATVLDRLTLLPFQIRMNKAARDSLAAAMAV
jgi:hypothetical protein